mgnify:CR=1 FL=1
MNSESPNPRKQFLDDHSILKRNLHHIAYSVPSLELFPSCLKYWTYKEHQIYMGYVEEDFLTEYIYPLSNNSLIKRVLLNEEMAFDHFCFKMCPMDYPFPLLKVTNKFYSGLWCCDVQFFYDKANDLKVEFIWL